MYLLLQVSCLLTQFLGDRAASALGKKILKMNCHGFGERLLVNAYGQVLEFCATPCSLRHSLATKLPKVYLRQPRRTGHGAEDSPAS